MVEPAQELEMGFILFAGHFADSLFSSPVVCSHHELDQHRQHVEDRKNLGPQSNPKNHDWLRPPEKGAEIECNRAYRRYEYLSGIPSPTRAVKAVRG